MVAFQESPELAVTEMGKAIEVCGEGAGVALEASSPDAALDLGRGPSRDRVRGLGLDRGEGLLGSGGSGTELAIEGLVDEGAQPGADVEVTLGAEALEALTGYRERRGYEVETLCNITPHNNTYRHIKAPPWRSPLPA